MRPIVMLGVRGVAMQSLCESKVYQLNMSMGVDDNIFRFEVSVHDLVLMKDLQCEEDLSCVELYPVFLLLLP